MAQLLVRKLDEDVKERLRARAKRNGRSVEAEAREILERSVGGKKPERITKSNWVRELSRRIEKTGVTYDDVEELDKKIAELSKTWRARDAMAGK